MKIGQLIVCIDDNNQFNVHEDIQQDEVKFGEPYLVIGFNTVGGVILENVNAGWLSLIDEPMGFKKSRFVLALDYAIDLISYYELLDELEIIQL